MPKPDITLPQLTPEQQEAVAELYLNNLAGQEPDKLPFGIFLPMAKLMVMHTVEVSFVKPSDEDEQSSLILLTQRPANDKFWPNQWHIPGSIVRANDPVKHEHDYDAAVSRVLDEVGGNVRILGQPKEYDTVRRKGTRGSEVTVRLLAETEGEPEHGKFFDAAGVLRQPPEAGLIETHAAAIKKVADTYSSIRAGQ